MTELDKMKRAKMYLDKLADGIDPLTDQELPNDTVLNNVRLARCFFYASDVLRRVIENGGEVRAHRKPKRADFFLTPEQLAAIPISDTPIRISNFVERLNAVIDTENTKKISTVAITNWLAERGFLEDHLNSKGKKSRRPTELGYGIGLSTEETQTARGTFTIVLYSGEAQRFLLDNLSAILDPEPEET